MNKKIKDKKLITPDGKLTLKVFNYADNDRLAILLFHNNGESDELTINLPGFFISDVDEGFINADINRVGSKGWNVVDILKEKGIIKESYGLRSYNLGKYEYVKFDLKKLKEFDNFGINEFEKRIDETNNIYLYIARI